MKRLILAVILAGAAAGPARAAAPLFYNGGVIQDPTVVVDATNFVNEGVFWFGTYSPYEFSSVLNYTNRNVMRNGYLDGYYLYGNYYSGAGVIISGGSGYTFDTAPATSQGGSRRMANSFYNAPRVGNSMTNAAIFCDYQLTVSATNIFNAGLLSVSEYGVVNLDGRNVDLSRGLIKVGGLSERSSTRHEGIFDQYWFFGTNQLHPNEEFVLNYPHTPAELYDVIMFPGYFTNQMQLELTDYGIGTTSTVNSTEFIYEQGTNRTVQLVFVRNLDSRVKTRVVSAGGSANALGVPIIEWSAAHTNQLGVVMTNTLYLSDAWGSFPTNLYITNFPYSPPPPNYVQYPPRSFEPVNFRISRAMPPNFLAALPGTNFTDKLPDFWGGSGVVTSALYSAYGVVVSGTPTTSSDAETIRNSPGRVEIKAAKTLTANLAEIDALTYLRLEATNHFVNSSNAAISTPFADVALASTNGQLNLSSVLQPYVSRCNGSIDAYSVRWTNDVAIAGTTNTAPVAFHVLVVDSMISDIVPLQIFDLSLKATNVDVGDYLYVLNSLSLNADRLNVSSNGVINLNLIGNIQWDLSAPHLKSLTNSGLIYGGNTLNFISHNSNGTQRAYESLANYGWIYGGGVSMSVTNLLNMGSLYSESGPLNVSAMQNVVLPPGGMLSAPLADISLACQNLFVTNHILRAGRSLSLSVTGRVESGFNAWDVLEGIRLPVKPASGDFGGTRIRSQAIASQESSHLWAGQDRGRSSAGFTNNASVGALTLEGALNSTFTFTGTTGGNAMYVDSLILISNAASFDAQGNLAELNIEPGMVLYYADATIGGASVAEYLNGKNGGRLQWVSSYVGPYSGTNVVYPDGTTNRLNSALVNSCNIDSDNDGTPNCLDSSPVFLPHQIQFAGKMVTAPSRALGLTWKTIGAATNRVYSTTNLMAPNWQLVTNFVSPLLIGPPATVQLNQSLGGISRFYRLELDAPQQ